MPWNNPVEKTMSEFKNTRRGFIKGAIASGFAVTGAAHAAPTPVPAKWDEEFDVVVVGSGAAGSAAALRSVELGLSVVLLEKLPVTGGSSTICNGGTAWAGTDMQKARGIVDSAQLFVDEMMKVGNGINERPLVEAYVANGLETYQWLKALGVEFRDVTTGAGMSVPRQHLVIPPQMLKTLNDKAKAKGAKFVLRTAAERLIRDDKGRVIGVQAKRGNQLIHYRARKGVVMAAGGFARSKELLRRFAPAVENALVLSGLGNAGDGTRMAWAAGADLVDLPYIKATFGFHPVTKTSAFVFYNGAIIVNKNGDRFTDESKPYKLLGDDALAQKDGIGFQVYDSKIRVVAQKDLLANTDVIEGKGELFSAPTLRELAQKIGVPADRLENAVRSYNEGIAKKADAFGRTSLSAGGGQPVAITQAPFYAFASTAVLLSTYCGPRINTRAQVLDVFGEAIEGLYAAGEGSGGVHGAAYMSGSSLGKGLVFGRLAAQAMAAK